jgi:peptidyl-prolyl cis-trans isomerase SurA
MPLARQRRFSQPLTTTTRGPCACWVVPAALLAFAVTPAHAAGDPVHAQQPGSIPATADARADSGIARPATRLAQASSSTGKSSATSTQSIVALVNDEPITGYEIEQRITLSLSGAPELQKRLQARLKSPKINDQFKAFAIQRLKANPPKTEDEQKARVKQLQSEFVSSIRTSVLAEFRPVARKGALEEIVDERLKMQEAKRLSVLATKEEVDRVLKSMAERNKMTPEQFTEYVTKSGASVESMRRRIEASLSWADVIRRLFGRQISVLGRDIDRFVATAEGQDDIELQLHRILLPVAASADQKRIAQQLGEGERLRAAFGGCKSMAGLANGLAGARFDDLGERKPTSIPEPTRSLLLSARDEEMLPPTIGEGGVELWAVCGRKAVKADSEKRQSAENDLRQKEFEIQSQKHLKDLRQDAHIEYR